MSGRQFAIGTMALIIMVPLAFGSPDGPASGTTKTAVMDALMKLASMYEQRNLEGALACFDADPGLVVYGTGMDEKRVGKSAIAEQFKRDWAQTESASLAYGWTSISATENIAWSASDVTFSLKAGGQQMSLPGRMTAVFRKSGDKWLISQAHFSTPAAGQAEGQSWPEEKK